MILKSNILAGSAPDLKHSCPIMNMRTGAVNVKMRENPSCQPVDMHRTLQALLLAGAASRLFP